MGIELNYLNAGLAVAVCAGIFWWIYSVSTRSQAQRRQELRLNTRKIAHQPWAEDKGSGRGNR